MAQIKIQNTVTASNEKTSDVIISVKNLKAWYDSFLALKDISMDIQRQKSTAIIGPSGCGKSSLIRCLNRMHEVVHGAKVGGQVLLDGEHLQQQRRPGGHPPPHRYGLSETEPVSHDVGLR